MSEKTKVYIKHVSFHGHRILQKPWGFSLLGQASSCTGVTLDFVCHSYKADELLTISLRAIPPGIGAGAPFLKGRQSGWEGQPQEPPRVMETSGRAPAWVINKPRGR